MAGRAPVVTRTPRTGTGKAKLSCWSKPGEELSSSRGCLLALADVYRCYLCYLALPLVISAEIRGYIEVEAMQFTSSHQGLFSPTPQVWGAQGRGVVSQGSGISGTAENSKSSLVEIPPLNQSKTTLRNVVLFQLWNH